MEGPFMELLFEVLALIPAVGGPAAVVISILTEGLKAFIPDGWAGRFALVLNAVFWFGAAIAVAAGYEAQWTDVMEQANFVLPAIMALIGWAMSVGGWRIVVGSPPVNRVY